MRSDVVLGENPSQPQRRGCSWRREPVARSPGRQPLESHGLPPPPGLCLARRTPKYPQPCTRHARLTVQTEELRPGGESVACPEGHSARWPGRDWPPGACWPGPRSPPRDLALSALPSPTVLHGHARHRPSLGPSALCALGLDSPPASSQCGAVENDLRVHSSVFGS